MNPASSVVTPQIAHRDQPEGQIDGGFSLARLGTLLLRHWRFLVAVPLVVIPMVVARILLQSRSYTARTSFLPEKSTASSAGLRGIAAQFGIDAPDAGRSPDFYIDLLGTDEILGQVVTHTYETRRDGRVVTGELVALLGITGTTPAIKRDRAIAKMRRHMSVNAARRSNIVSVSVRESSPDLAVAIAQRMLDAIAEFDQHTRQSKAAAERQFLERRLEFANLELRSAEQALQAFSQRNRVFLDSPGLQFEHDRLQRKVDERQTVVTSLVQAFEQARVDEVRDTPVLTIIQKPRAPSTGDPRHLIPRTLLAGMLSFGFAFAVVILREAFRNANDQDPSLADEFARVRRDFLRMTRIGKVNS